MKPKKRNCQPAFGILERIGMSNGELARELQVAVSTVGRWPLAFDDGGRGGIIPFRYWKPLRRIARKRGVVLTTADFLPVEHRSADR